MNEVRIVSRDPRAREYFENFCSENPEVTTLRKKNYAGGSAQELVLLVENLPEIVNSITMLIAVLKAKDIPFRELADALKGQESQE